MIKGLGSLTRGGTISRGQNFQGSPKSYKLPWSEEKREKREGVGKGQTRSTQHQVEWGVCTADGIIRVIKYENRFNL